MTDKKFCDICGNELKEFGESIFGSRWLFWGIIQTKHINADFCSEKCLLKFIKENFEEKEECQ